MAEAIQIRNETARDLMKFNKDYEIGLIIDGDNFGTIDFLINKDYYLNIDNFSNSFLETYQDNIQGTVQVEEFSGIQVAIYYMNGSIAMYRSYDKQHSDYLLHIWKESDRYRKIVKIKDRIFR